MFDTRNSAKNICTKTEIIIFSRPDRPRAPREHGEDSLVLMNVLPLTKYKENGDLLLKRQRNAR